MDPRDLLNVGEVVVRPERPGDEDAIRRVHLVAFSYGGGRDGSGEARLVDLLRASDAWVAGLSLVAEDAASGGIIGHLLFSKAIIETGAGDVETLALAPLAVLPGHEGSRAGTRLMRHGLAEARRLGFRSVIVLGHPKYYRRFGFVPAGRFAIEAPFPVPADAWMALELEPGALAGVAGRVRYPAAFDAVT